MPGMLRDTEICCAASGSKVCGSNSGAFVPAFGWWCVHQGGVGHDRMIQDVRMHGHKMRHEWIWWIWIENNRNGWKWMEYHGVAFENWWSDATSRTWRSARSVVVYRHLQRVLSSRLLWACRRLDNDGYQTTFVPQAAHSKKLCNPAIQNMAHCITLHIIHSVLYIYVCVWFIYIYISIACRCRDLDIDK